MKSKYAIWKFLLIVSLCLLISFNLMANMNEDKEQHADIDWTLSCVECHQEETPEAVSEWQASAHGVMNFGCYMCHGDGVEEFAASPSTERCISCHSAHEGCTMNPDMQACFSCHPGHTLKVEKTKQ